MLTRVPSAETFKSPPLCCTQEGVSPVKLSHLHESLRLPGPPSSFEVGTHDLAVRQSEEALLPRVRGQATVATKAHSD